MFVVYGVGFRIQGVGFKGLHYNTNEKGEEDVQEVHRRLSLGFRVYVVGFRT